MDETQDRKRVTLLIRDLNSDNFGYDALDDLVALGATVQTTHNEKLGHHFVTITLPSGYTTNEECNSSGFKCIEFFDENGNKRGAFVIKISNPKISNICLFTKYNIVSKRYKASDFIFERVYFGNNDEQLFGAGVVSINRRDCSALFVESQLADLRNQCRIKADELYPDWQNPLAYWNEDLSLNEGQLLVRNKEE